jgi:hypothetical protein
MSKLAENIARMPPKYVVQGNMKRLTKAMLQCFGTVSIKLSKRTNTHSDNGSNNAFTNTTSSDRRLYKDGNNF